MVPRSNPFHKISIQSSTSALVQLKQCQNRHLDDKSSLHQRGRLSPLRPRLPMEHFPRLNLLRLSSKLHLNSRLHLNNKLHLNPELKLNKLLQYKRKLRLLLLPPLLPSLVMRPSLSMHLRRNRQILPTLLPATVRTGVNNQTTDSTVKVKDKDKGEEVDLAVKVREVEVVDKDRGEEVVEHLGVRRDLLGEVRLLLSSRRRV